MKSEKELSLKGVIVPIVTPFDEDEEVDEEVLRKLTDWLIDEGVHGLFPCGSCGEAAKLMTEERKRVVKTVVEQANGRVPILAGTGTPSTKETIELTKFAEDVGADAAVVVQPYYFQPSEKMLFEHYRIVSESVHIPIIVYSIPQCTGYTLSVELVSRLAEIEGIIALKDSSGDISAFMQMIDTVGDKIDFFQGKDSLFVPSLIIGAKGGVLGIANLYPRYMVEAYEKFAKGQVREAMEMQMKIVPLLYKLTSLKDAMNMTGIQAGKKRKPALSLTYSEKMQLKKLLTSFGSRGIKNGKNNRSI